MDLLRRRITALCTGWEVAQIRAIVAETLHEIVEPLVYAEATELIAEHQRQRRRGRRAVRVRAGGRRADRGARRCGPLPGHPDERGGRSLHRRDRVLLLRRGQGAGRPRHRRRRGYRLADCRAYSDSITDLPLLEAVGHPTVVNPDRALRREAVQRGWPILTFVDPVALRSVPGPEKRTTLARPGWERRRWSGCRWYGHRRRTARLTRPRRRRCERPSPRRSVPEPVHCRASLAVLRVTDYKERTDSWSARGGAAEKHPSTPSGAPCAKVGHSTHSTPREACRRGPAYRDAGRRGHYHDT